MPKVSEIEFEAKARFALRVIKRDADLTVDGYLDLMKTEWPSSQEFLNYRAAARSALNGSWVRIGDEK